jgi:hypothetical protein
MRSSAHSGASHPMWDHAREEDGKVTKTILFLMMFGILASCALASAQSEEGNGELLFRSLGYGIWATQVADIVSTELLLRKGWEETNPLWKNDDRRRFVGYPLKMGFAWAVNKGTERIYRSQPVLATLIRAGIVAGYSVVVSNNLQLSMTVRF